MVAGASLVGICLPRSCFCGWCGQGLCVLILECVDFVCVCCLLNFDYCTCWLAFSLVLVISWFGFLLVWWVALLFWIC